MNRIATTVGLVFVLAHGGLSSSEVEDAKSDGKQIQLVLDFRGLVAFLPQGEGEGYKIDQPMGGSGEVKSIVALLPRADDGDILGDDQIPERFDFADHGQRHALHFAALRISMANVGGSGTGSLLLPLPSGRKSSRSTYSIELASSRDPKCEAAHVKCDVAFEQMDQVPRVVEGPKVTSAVPGPTNPAAEETAFVATVVLKKRETLTASEDPESIQRRHSDSQTNTWEYTSDQCRLAGAWCRHQSTQTGYNRLASQAQAIRSVPGDAEVWLAITEHAGGKTNVSKLPLKASSDGKVVVRVESGPAPELFANELHDMDHFAFEHFKLFHLIAAKRTGSYYFPELRKIQIDPYCTPLAQFVQKPR